MLKTEVIGQITEAWRAERAKLFTLKWGQRWRLVRCKQKSQDIYCSYLPSKNISLLMNSTQKQHAEVAASINKLLIRNNANKAFCSW